jgi:hypothetical protein
MHPQHDLADVSSNMRRCVGPKHAKIMFYVGARRSRQFRLRSRSWAPPRANRWPRFEVTYRYRYAKYHVRVDKEVGVVLG